MTKDELTRKIKIKKIATLSYVADECDDVKAKHRKMYYDLIEAIFDKVLESVKQLKEA